MSHVFAVLLVAILPSPIPQDDEDDQRLDALIAQLKDSDVKTRMGAAISIGNLGEKVKKRAIPALRKVLLDPKEDFNVHNHAFVAIQKMGIESHSVLIECAENGTTFVRRISTGALGGMGAQAVPMLIKALKDPDRNVRKIAIRSLGRIGPAAKPAIPALEKATRDANEYVAVDAARTLWLIAREGKSQEPFFPKGKTDRGLAAFVHSPKKTYEVGEPILLNYGIAFEKNGDELSTRVWPPIFAIDPNNGSWFEVTGPDGKPMKYHGIFVSLAGPLKATAENTTLIRSGEFIGRKDADLTYAYNLTQPGTYTVRWFYQPRGTGAWSGKLQSNELKLSIIKLRQTK